MDTRPPTITKMLDTPTGRYIQNIDPPDSLTALFPSPTSPPRCIASKSYPDRDGIITVGIFPLMTDDPTIELFQVPVSALVHTTVMP